MNMAASADTQVPQRHAIGIPAAAYAAFCWLASGGGAASRRLIAQKLAQSTALLTVPQASSRALPNNKGATKPATIAKTSICIVLCTDDAMPLKFGKMLRVTTVIPGSAIDMPSP